MPKGIYAAASAMVVETRALDVVANNLANAQSAGYRRQSALHDAFVDRLAQEGRGRAIDGDGGAGIASAGTWFHFAEGTKEQTGAPLDVALTGPGFFRVRDAEGRALLTRAGRFTLDGAGRLTTPEGYAVEGQGGAITVPPEAQRLVIDEAGRIYAESPSTTGPVQTLIDQLRVVDVARPAELQARTGQYFVSPAQGESDAPGARVAQGWIERGNVDPVRELVDMVSIQRRFESAQRALKQQDATGRDYSDLLRGG